MFNIHMGIPEMDSFWNNLSNSIVNKTASKNDEILYKKLGKTLCLLSNNPRHPGLESHEISALTHRYGMKVWQSYIENKTPNAGRLFWVYGPNKSDITIIGIEPHPNDKSNAYKKITLSSFEK